MSGDLELLGIVGGKLNDIQGSIDEQSANITDSKLAVESVLDQIGLSTDTGGSATAGTVMGKLNKVLNQLLGGSGAVKSVQRGLVNAGATSLATNEFKYNGGSDPYSSYIDITISAVNPVKSSAKIYYGGMSSNVKFMVPVLRSETTLRVYFASVSASSTQIKLNNGLSWEVIEFY